MTGTHGHEPLKDLQQRLKAAQAKTEEPVRAAAGTRAGSGMAVGLQIAVELIAGIAIGVGLGWFLDGWLGTKPWMLLVFTIVGFVAGLMNVIRRAKQLEADARRAAESAKADEA